MGESYIKFKCTFLKTLQLCWKLNMFRKSCDKFHQIELVVRKRKGSVPSSKHKGGWHESDIQIQSKRQRFWLCSSTTMHKRRKWAIICIVVSVIRMPTIVWWFGVWIGYRFHVVHRKRLAKCVRKQLLISIHFDFLISLAPYYCFCMNRLGGNNRNFSNFNLLS